MFLLLPTSNAYAAVASISLTLLERYWPNHPPVHVLHHEAKPHAKASERLTLHDRGPQDRSAWLGNVVSFLGDRSEELFLLMLDDYAMCGPAKEDWIDRGRQFMESDRSIGLFPLGWYPSARRIDRGDEIVRLQGAPILLQAAIWRRDWFLQLADQIDPRASAWGFEAAATQIARKVPREICSIAIPAPRYRGGHLVDGFEKSDWPLPYHNLMHAGKPELRHEAFLRSEGLAFPDRGMGDTVARIAQATGVAQITEAIANVTGRDCGCARRRERLNQAFPYRTSL